MAEMVKVYGVWSDDLPTGTFQAKRGKSVYLELQEAFETAVSNKCTNRAVYYSYTIGDGALFYVRDSLAKRSRAVLNRKLKNWKPVPSEELVELIDYYNALMVENNLTRDSNPFSPFRIEPIGVQSVDLDTLATLRTYHRKKVQ